MKSCIACVVALLLCASAESAQQTAIPSQFDSVGADRQAIEALLNAYVSAVSTKNQALFETLLLDKTIPFSSTDSALKGAGADGSTRNYEEFRKGVFESEPFMQRFEHVHIQQDGPLAQVSLVFVNTTSSGSSWGWKTMQLLKVDGHWKIASEFFTGHA